MSLTNDKYLGAVKEIAHQMLIKKSAQEQITAIKDRMHEEEDFNKSELQKYATMYFKKMETPSKFAQEMDLNVRIYEEVDETNVDS